MNYIQTVRYIPPEMKTIELRVATSAATEDLTPTSGKKIRVFGLILTQYVDSSSTVTTTLRGTLAFGTDHTGTATKVLASYRESDVYDDAGVSISGINVVGAVDEVVRLTNVTSATDDIISRAIVYYTEE